MIKKYSCNYLLQLKHNFAAPIWISNSPHVSRLLVAGELTVGESLHALQELSGLKGTGGGCRRICGCRRVPVSGHLLSVGSRCGRRCRRAEGESLGQGSTGNGRHVVGVTTLLAPRTLHRLLVDLRVVNGDDGVGGRLLGGETEG